MAADIKFTTAWTHFDSADLVGATIDLVGDDTSFTPKAAIFITTDNKPADAFGTPSNQARYGLGFTDGLTNRVCTTLHVDGQANMNVHRALYTTACVASITATGNSRGQARFDSWLPGGVRLEINATWSDDDFVGAILIGGDSVANVSVDTIVMNGNSPVDLNLGFDPNLSFFSSQLANSSGNFGTFAMGMAANDAVRGVKQLAYAVTESSGAATSQAARYTSADSVIAQLSAGASAAVQWKAEAQYPGGGIFRLAPVGASDAGTDHVYALNIEISDGPDFDIVTNKSISASSTGQIVVDTLDFQGSAAFWLTGWGSNSVTGDVRQDSTHLGFGLSHENGAGSTPQSIGKVDATESFVTTSECNNIKAHGLAGMDPSNQEDYLAFFDGFAADGFSYTPSITIQGINTIYGHWLVIGPGTASETPVNRDGELPYNVTGLAGKDNQHLWNGAEVLPVDALFPWNSFEFTASDSQLLWNALNSLNRDSQLLYNAYEITGNDSQLIYNMIQLIGSNGQLLYDIAAASGQVGRVLSVLWNGSEFVNNNCETPWYVLNHVARDCQSLWLLLDLVQRDGELLWSLLNEVFADNELPWDMIGVVQGDNQLRWRILSTVINRILGDTCLRVMPFKQEINLTQYPQSITLFEVDICEQNDDCC